jgi:hypothetical protein
MKPSSAIAPRLSFIIDHLNGANLTAEIRDTGNNKNIIEKSVTSVTSVTAIHRTSLNDPITRSFLFFADGD